MDAPETAFGYLLKKGIVPRTQQPRVALDFPALEEAAVRLYTDPSALTPADVDQLTALDADLGVLAHAKSLGFRGDEQARQTKFGATPLSAAQFFKWGALVLQPVLLVSKRKHADRQAALEQRLQQQVDALERRVRELEAQLQTERVA